jgi:hypothetical protein
MKFLYNKTCGVYEKRMYLRCLLKETSNTAWGYDFYEFCHPAVSASAPASSDSDISQQII